MRTDDDEPRREAIAVYQKWLGAQVSYLAALQFDAKRIGGTSYLAAEIDKTKERILRLRMAIAAEANDPEPRR